MKVIVIGDIHGRSIWREIVSDNSDADLFIFLGDYFDSRENIDALSQITNFRDIMEFKRNNPGKVITLLGNHDFHYTSGCIGSYTGFDYSTYYNMRLELDGLIKEGELLIAHQIGGYLFTHAGVTKTFCESWGIDTNNLVESLNDFLIYKPHIFNFRSGKSRDPYGDDIGQGPIWVRPKSLLEDGLPYFHVVGHTTHDDVVAFKNERIEVICTDALVVGKYLELVFHGEIIPDKVYKVERNIKQVEGYV